MKTDDTDCIVSIVLTHYTLLTCNHHVLTPQPMSSSGRLWKVFLFSQFGMNCWVVLAVLMPGHSRVLIISGSLVASGVFLPTLLFLVHCALSLKKRQCLCVLGFFNEVREGWRRDFVSTVCVNAGSMNRKDGQCDMTISQLTRRETSHPDFDLMKAMDCSLQSHALCYLAYRSEIGHYDCLLMLLAARRQVSHCDLVLVVFA